MQNAMFALMMYLLGCVTAWLTIPDVRGAHLYENLYAELFFDIMLLCLLLRIIPRKIRELFRALLYVVLYGLRWWTYIASSPTIPRSLRPL